MRKFVYKGLRTGLRARRNRMVEGFWLKFEVQGSTFGPSLSLQLKFMILSLAFSSSADRERDNPGQRQQRQQAQAGGLRNRGHLDAKRRLNIRSGKIWPSVTAIDVRTLCRDRIPVPAIVFVTGFFRIKVIQRASRQEGLRGGVNHERRRGSRSEFRQTRGIVIELR